MKVYINDSSFIGQAKNVDDAISLLDELVETIYEIKTFSCKNKGAISKGLKNCCIIKDLSLIEFIHGLDRKIKKQREAKERYLHVLCTKPHYKSKHGQGDTILDEQGESLRNTCFDSAAVSKCGAVVVSLNNCPKYSSRTIKVISSVANERNIMNVSYLIDAKNLRWNYEPNPKHRNKPKNIGKHTISEMDLSNDVAQKVLTNGFFINEKVLSFYENNWYCFPSHLANNFHGYKITFHENNKLYAHVNEIMKRICFTPRGQIWHGYC